MDKLRFKKAGKCRRTARRCKAPYDEVGRDVQRKEYQAGRGELGITDEWRNGACHTDIAKPERIQRPD